MGTPIAQPDLDAERAVLASLLINPSTVEQVTPVLDGDEFAGHGHGELYAAMVAAWTKAGTFDTTTIKRVNPKLVDELWSLDTPSLSLLGQHAERVAQLWSNRETARLLAEAGMALAKPGASDAEVIDQLIERHHRVRHVGFSTDDQDYEQWAAPPTDPEALRAGWVVPGVLRRQGRLMLVAPEGIGKSTVIRQIAALTAAGIHPFVTSSSITPLRVLVVDLENDPSTAVAQDGSVDAASPHGMMLTLARRAPGWDRHNLRVVSRPEGMDLRARSDRRRLEAVLARVRPDLVTFGPIYKSYRRDPREDDETLSADLQRILDRWRTRYDCAWVFEHHAPKGNGGRNTQRRDPFGSSLWKRWPDIGIRLDEHEEGDPRVLRVGRFRYDRYPVPGIPAELHRGGSWPWVGHWTDEPMF